MSYKTFRMWQGIMGMVIGGVTGLSVALGVWIVPIPVIFVGLIIITILRRRVKEVIADERTYAVAEKAARLTFQIAVIGLAAIGIVLLVVSHGTSHELTQTGFAFEYAACALLVINALAYNYYSRKLGGKNE
jgi:uncharacterized membrane protein